MADWALRRARQNKANSRTRRGGKGWAWPPVSSAEPIAQNEPNSGRSFKCKASSQASPAASARSPLTSNLTLQTSGGTPAAQRQSCETKPIWEEVSSVKWQVSSERSQGANTPGPATSNFTLETVAKPRACETKPISHLAGQPFAYHGSPLHAASPPARSGIAQDYLPWRRIGTGCSPAFVPIL
jgi:hypothetical protein